VGKFEVEGILDGGAQIVIISKALWIDLGRPIDDNYPKITLESANKSREKTLGLCANLEVTVFGILLYLQAHVVEDAPFDLLLGRPFFALARTKEETMINGDSHLTLHDPNSNVALKVPTKPRANRR
ncbi:hypothetical protein AURDEDRAFT_48316, partial [Auricularia subglabra TFB-10046 SS5]